MKQYKEIPVKAKEKNARCSSPSKENSETGRADIYRGRLEKGLTAEPQSAQSKRRDE
jgi:hypothetical protein